MPTEQEIERLEKRLDKILTISARDYCEMYGKNLSDYTCRGINEFTEGNISNRKIIKHRFFPEIVEETFEEGLISFLKSIPEGAEVVVDYRPSSYMLSGTALIPKK